MYSEIASFLGRFSESCVANHESCRWPQYPGGRLTGLLRLLREQKARFAPVADEVPPMPGCQQLQARLRHTNSAASSECGHIPLSAQQSAHFEARCQTPPSFHHQLSPHSEDFDRMPERFVTHCSAAVRSAGRLCRTATCAPLVQSHEHHMRTKCSQNYSCALFIGAWMVGHPAPLVGWGLERHQRDLKAEGPEAEVVSG